MPLSPYPAFSVSPSSARRLDTCARQHFWAVYGFWGGWDAGLPATDPRRLAYILKNGRSLASLVGTLVHDFARTALDAKQADIPFNAPQAHINARVALSLAVRLTLAGKHLEDPKGTPALLEVFYQEQGWEDRVHRYAEELDASIEALLLNEHFRAVVEGDAEVLYAEDRHQLHVSLPVGEVNPHAPGWEPEPFAVPVWVVPDLVYRPAGSERRRVIVDWKTGRVDDAARAQVGVYAAWLSARDGIAPEDIAAVAVYLQHYVEKPVAGSAELVAEAVDGLRGSARKALAYVEDGDPRVNRPKPMEVFEQLPADSKECRYCAFRRLCGRG